MRWLVLLLFIIVIVVVTAKPTCKNPKKDKTSEDSKKIGYVMTQIKNAVGEVDLLLNAKSGEYKIVAGFEKKPYKEHNKRKEHKKTKEHKSKGRKCKKPTHRKAGKHIPSHVNANGDHSIGIPAGKVGNSFGEDHAGSEPAKEINEEKSNSHILPESGQNNYKENEITPDEHAGGYKKKRA